MLVELKPKHLFNQLIYRFIEAHLDVFDKININDIVSTFNVSRATATRHMNYYKSLESSSFNWRFVMYGPYSYYQKGFGFKPIVMGPTIDSGKYLNELDVLIVGRGAVRGSDVLDTKVIEKLLHSHGRIRSIELANVLKISRDAAFKRLDSLVQSNELCSVKVGRDNFYMLKENSPFKELETQAQIDAFNNALEYCTTNK
ncbi:hypothetical protein [Vibrio sp. SCSIO 43155]|uniref:hypothetical protein n=1 Tax=Vibrio sp. SCSIO 43155 TaxID=2819099 RepID=UPI0020765370|nr:hypothetical protein [Vibrio sp. SCSIO 43155]USD58570.1 hypothetical protein J4N44_26830 [Vibrio sp. SCSIO 43155]